MKVQLSYGSCWKVQFSTVLEVCILFQERVNALRPCKIKGLLFLGGLATQLVGVIICRHGNRTAFNHLNTRLVLVFRFSF